MTTRLTKRSILFLILFLYAATSCAMRYVLTGHRSGIPTQLLYESTSPTFSLASRQEIEGATWDVKSRCTTFTKFFFGNRSFPEASDE